MTTQLEKLEAIRTEYQKAVEKTGKTAFKEFFTAFFKENPSITAVRWTQSTPAFNDGDPCVFGLGEVEAARDEEAEDFYGQYSDESKGILTALRELEHTLNEHSDALEQVFGDGQQITVFHDGKFETEDYYDY